MKRLRYVTIGSVVIAIVLSFLTAALLGCSRKTPEAKEIKIGAVLPLTGEIAEYGKRCKAGIDIAIDELNKGGGIKGQALKILYEDSRGNPQEGVNALQKLIKVDGVRVVVGAVASSVTLAMEPIATKNKVILFSPASSSPKLTGISKYFFRTWPSDVLEARALANCVYSELGLKNVGTLYVNNDYGLGLNDEFTKRFNELSGRVSVVETYEQGATDFRTQITKIKAKDPNAIYLAGYHREMAVATKQIRELGIDAQILGDADYGVQELLEIAGVAAEGAIYSIPEYEPANGSVVMKQFAEVFRAKYGSSPSIFEANAYDAVKILAQAIAGVGLDPERISTYISSLKNYAGASGDISFGIKGEVTKPVSIKTVKNGKFIPFPVGSPNSVNR